MAAYNNTKASGRLIVCVGVDGWLDSQESPITEQAGIKDAYACGGRGTRCAG